MKKFIYLVKSIYGKVPRIVLQLGSIGLIGFLAWSDFTSMRSLFRDLDYTTTDQIMFALTLAFFLEGIPFYLGLAWSEHIDKTGYTTNDRKVTRVGVVLSLITYVLAAGVTVFLRILWMSKNGGLEGFINDSYGYVNDTNKFIGELFKLSSPILTSLLAFIASWMAFRSNQLADLEQKVDRLRDKCYIREQEFRSAHLRNKAARASLWTTIADPDVEPMPGNFEVFRQQSFIRIREKLNDTCLTSYPTQVERFSSRVESELAECLLEISRHSTLPQSISRMSIRDLIDTYEQQVHDPAEAWDYNQAGPALKEELERALNNAVVVAQFNTGRKYKKKKVW